MKNLLRKACESDIKCMVNIVENWIKSTNWMPKRFSSVALTEIMIKALPIREIWVLGTPIRGYISFNPVNAQVMGLYVKKPGYGDGKLLLDKVKEDRDYISLWSHSKNVAAHRFYSREGFSFVTSIKKGSDGIAEMQFQWTR